MEFQSQFRQPVGQFIQRKPTQIQVLQSPQFPNILRKPTDAGLGNMQIFQMLQPCQTFQMAQGLVLRQIQQFQSRHPGHIQGRLAPHACQAQAFQVFQLLETGNRVILFRISARRNNHQLIQMRHPRHIQHRFGNRINQT